MKKLFFVAIVLCCIVNLKASDWQKYAEKSNSFLVAGMPDSAMKYAKLSLSVAEIEFGKESVYFAASLNIIGLVYLAVPNLDEAEKYLTQAFDLAKVILKPYDADYLIIQSNVVLLYIQRGDFRGAEEICRDAMDWIDIEYGTDNYLYEAYAGLLGLSLIKQQRNLEAVEVLNEALYISKISGGTERAEYYSILTNLAIAYSETGDYNTAVYYFDMIVPKIKIFFPPLNPLYNHVFNAASANYVRVMRTDEAIDCANEVLLNYEKYNFPSLENLGFAYRNVGAALNMKGKYGEAERYLTESYKVFESNDITSSDVFYILLNDLALFYNETGKFSLSEEFFLKALEISNRKFSEFSNKSALILNNLALLYTNLGRYKEAEVYFHKSLSVTETISGRTSSDFLNVLNNLGLLYVTTGRYPLAESNFKEVVATGKDVLGENNPAFLRFYGNLAFLYFSMNRLKDAEEVYDYLTQLALKIGGDALVEYSYFQNNLSLIYFYTDRSEKAEAIFDKGLEIIKNSAGEENIVYARMLSNYGLVSGYLNKYEKAESLFVKSLSILEKIVGQLEPTYITALNNLSEIYLRKQDYQESEKSFQKVIELFTSIFDENHPDFVNYAMNLTAVKILLDKYEEAETFFGKIFDSHRSQVSSYFPYLSEKEKTSYLNKLRRDMSIFASYAAYRYEDKKTISSELTNLRIFYKSILQNSSKKVFEAVSQSDDPEIINTYNDLKSNREFLAKLYSIPRIEVEAAGINIDSIEAVTNEFEKLLNELTGLDNQSNSYVSVSEIKSKLKNGEAVIEIIRHSNEDFTRDKDEDIQYTFLIIRPDFEIPVMVNIDNGRFLESLLYINFRKNLSEMTAPNYFEYEDADYTDSAYIYYWQPIAIHLSGINKIYISADGIYNKLNAATFKNPETQKYLIEDFDISYITGLRDILDINSSTNKKGAKDAVLIGYPNYFMSVSEIAENSSVYYASERDVTTSSAVGELDSLTRYNIGLLPGTEIEIKIIDSLLIKAGYNVESYLWNNAVEEAVKIVQSPQILHIATHGFFINDVTSKSEKVMGIQTDKAAENPLLRAGLLLAGSNTTLNSADPDLFNYDDGILTAFEAQNLNLDNTELVVLSACETGLGEIVNGEGVYGLQRALIVAGADAILMSLWKVNDEATQKLMTYFYENFVQTGDKAASLKLAQLKLKEELTFPYYWGAFILIGE